VSGSPLLLSGLISKTSSSNRVAVLSTTFSAILLSFWIGRNPFSDSFSAVRHSILHLKTQSFSPFRSGALYFLSGFLFFLRPSFLSLTLPTRSWFQRPASSLSFLTFCPTEASPTFFCGLSILCRDAFSFPLPLLSATWPFFLDAGTASILCLCHFPFTLVLSPLAFMHLSRLLSSATSFFSHSPSFLPRRGLQNRLFCLFFFLFCALFFLSLFFSPSLVNKLL